MIRQSLEFHVGSCRMWLHMPTAMIGMSIPKLRKFFQWASQDQGNNENMQYFFSCIQTVHDLLKDDWDTESKYFVKSYKDPKFDEKGNYIKDKTESEKRQTHNNELLTRVKAAKREYDNFLKKIPKLGEIRELYLD